MPLFDADMTELVKLKADVVKGDAQMMKTVIRIVKSSSFAVEKNIKQEMPVGDTGRARASWGHWTSQNLRGGTKKAVNATPGSLSGALRKANAGLPSSADSIWRESADGLSITQGSNVVYIERLNQGHSRQAPAGFIDRAGLTGQLELDKALGFIDPLSSEYAGRLYVATFG